MNCSVALPAAPAVDLAPASPLAVIGRQPIYDRHLKIHGYELLFRSAEERERGLTASGESCSARVVVNTFMEMGLENVVGSEFAFINVNRAFLLSGLLPNLPASRVVLEILEDTPPDEEVIATLKALKAAGYRLALDDFIYKPELEPFIALASIVKLELVAEKRAEMMRLINRLKQQQIQVVIERIETHEELELCRKLGADLFQGYFLAKPAILKQQRAPSAARLTALQILALLGDGNATVEQLETAIGRDVTLSYRLLRVINSAAFAMSSNVESLQQAVLFLGRDRIRSWVSLLVLSGLSDKPSSLLSTGMIRARMCEQLADLVEPGHRAASFTAGLFSILDAVLDTPMEQLLASLPLAPSITQALLDRSGPLGDVLKVVIANERCEWVDPGLSPVTDSQIRDAYLEAVRWASTMNEPTAK